MAARRKGRILAFQALFAWDATRLPVADLLEFGWLDDEQRLKLGDDGVVYPKLLIGGTIEHIQEVDEQIRTHLTNWDFDRLNKADLAILRISVYSLLFQKDLHPSIVIDEAVDISKEFSSDESYRFVNAILDHVRKDLEAGKQ